MPFGKNPYCLRLNPMGSFQNELTKIKNEAF